MTSNEQDTWKPPNWGKRGKVDSEGWIGRAVDVGVVSRELQQMKEATREKYRQLGKTQQQIEAEEKQAKMEAKEKEIAEVTEAYYHPDGTLKAPPNKIVMFRKRMKGNKEIVDVLFSCHIDTPALMRSQLLRGLTPYHPWGWEQVRGTHIFAPHIEPDNTPGDFPCYQCGFLFDTLEEAQAHTCGQESYGPKRRRISDIEPESKPAEVEVKQPDPMAETPTFPCYECGKSFDTQVQLDGHKGGTGHGKK